MITRARPEPCTYSPSWPDAPCDDPVAEKARLFTVHLREAVGSRPLREIRNLTGVDPATLSRIIAGHAWPDGYTIARLEVRLHPDLWPAAED
jgi:hypothetical protein